MQRGISMDQFETIQIQLSNGETKSAKIISILESKYYIYSFGETDTNGLELLYASKTEMQNDKQVFVNVTTEEWEQIKKMLQNELAKGGN